jgi:hypothetical protein
MKQAKTKLEKVVKQWLKEKGKDYKNGARGAYNDLREGGCVSGIVSELIYYEDTIKFFEEHKAEINTMLADMLDPAGYDCPADILGDKWYKADPLALEYQNQNLLAWFGFEETAHHLMEE